VSAPDAVSRSRAQFARAVRRYAASPLFRSDAGLRAFVALVEPAPEHRVLDVATGAGFVALALAPLVREVIATAITAEMLAEARRLAAEREAGNVRFAFAQAEALPFRDARFDRVTVRSAPHHFADVGEFAREAARVLKPGGRLVVMDSGAPEDPEANAWLDRLERLRDASHARNYTVTEWRAYVTAAGLLPERIERWERERAWRLEFDEWTARAGTPADRKAAARRLLGSAPPSAIAAYRIECIDGRWWFDIPRVVVVARRPERPLAAPPLRLR